MPNLNPLRGPYNCNIGWYLAEVGDVNELTFILTVISCCFWCYWSKTMDVILTNRIDYGGMKYPSKIPLESSCFFSPYYK